MTSSCLPILCADSESVLHPESLGLEGESLSSQSWLRIFSDAQEARDHVRSAPSETVVWIACCDQMEGINLAAAMKHDRPDIEVDLIDYSPNGSLFSRARVAGISEVMDKSSFLNKYQLGKRAYAQRLIKESEALGRKDLPRSFEDQHQVEVSNLTSSQSPVTENGQIASSAMQVAQVMPSGMPIVQRKADSAKADVNFSSAEAARLQNESQKPSNTFVLSIVGAGGGTGKSAIAALCGCYAVRSGRKAVILDADLQFGDIAYLCGDESPLRIDEMIEAPLRIEGMKGHESVPPILAAPRNLERSEMASDHFDQALSLLRQKYDIVIVNTGSTWSDIHMQLLEASTYTLFVLDQRPSSIRACRHALDLCSRCGIASQSFLFAINRCSRKALFSRSDIATAFQGARIFELKDGGHAVEEQLGIGQPSNLFDIKNGLAESVSAMMDDLLPADQQQMDFLMGNDERKVHRRFRGKRGR